MTRTEILNKAVEKAIQHGFRPTGDVWNTKWWLEGNRSYMLIFSHDFAQAFWNEYEHGVHLNMYGSQDGQCQYWKNCLQAMVLEADPIKYLEPFLTSICEVCKAPHKPMDIAKTIKLAEEINKDL